MQSADAGRPTSSHRLWRVVRVLLSLGLIAALAYHVGTDQIIAHFSAATWPFIALATVILAVNVLLVTPRWSLILDVLGYRTSWRALFESVLLGFFLNQVLPTAVGGDVLRAWRAKQLGAPWQTSIHSVLVDRASGVLVSLLGAAALLPFAGYHEGGQIIEWSIGAVAGCAVFGLAGIWALGRWSNAAHRLCESLWAFVRRPCVSMVIFALAALNQMLPVAAIWVLASGLNISLAALDIALITFISTLAATIPISFAGWGIREGTLVYLLGLYGVSSDAAFAVSVLYGFALTLSAAPGAVVLMRGRLRPPTAEVN
jgi:glycosyltransferase 2 family protein